MKNQFPECRGICQIYILKGGQMPGEIGFWDKSEVHSSPQVGAVPSATEKQLESQSRWK